jgi:hypothetical protein
MTIRLGVRMLAAFVAVLSSMLAGPRVSMAQTDNPFCGASVDVIPWNVAADTPLANNDGADYALEMLVDGKRDVAARVTLITDTDAYSVAVPRTTVSTQSYGNVTLPFLVHFDKATPVRYTFVDGVGVDGADVASCPTFVAPVEIDQRQDAGHLGRGVTMLHPTYLQALPKLACGAVYKDATLKQELHSNWSSDFGKQRREALVKLYIDSNGRVLKEELFKSSGLDAFDQVALGDAHETIYNPAMFLCTPVVSIYIYREVYNGD